MKWIGGIYIILTFSFIQSMESPKEILYFNTYIFLEIVLNFFFLLRTDMKLGLLLKCAFPPIKYYCISVTKW